MHEVPTPLERKIAKLLNERTSLGLDYCERMAVDTLKLIRREMALALRQRVQADRENING